MTDPLTCIDASEIGTPIEAGVNVNSADEEQRTALLFAAFNGHTLVVKLLLDSGALLSQRDGVGRTALMFAATGDNAEAVELLLEAGAEVNAVDTGEGFTALMHAAAEGHANVVKVLLKHNADPALRDKDGDSARDFATRNRHDDVGARRRIGCWCRSLDMTNVVTCNAVKGIRAAKLAGEQGFGGRDIRLPQFERSAIGCNEDGVATDPGTTRVVSAVPGNGNRRRIRPGRQRVDLTVWSGGVDGVECLQSRVGSGGRVLGIDLVSRDDCLQIEADQPDIVDFGAGGEVGFGLDEVAEVPLADAGAVFRRQKAGQDVGSKRSGRVD